MTDTTENSAPAKITSLPALSGFQLDIPQKWVGEPVKFMLRVPTKDGVLMAGGTLAAVTPGGLVIHNANSEVFFSREGIIHVEHESRVHRASGLPHAGPIVVKS